MKTDIANYTHQCLIAMPAMADPRFAHAITYIVKHDEEGALGLVINKPLDISLKSLLDEVLKPEQPVSGEVERPVLFGGPVNTQMGFVLHRERGEWGNTLPIEDGIYVTTSKDILDAIASGLGPQSYLVALGYAGWTPGQLEQEMKENAWLTCPANPDLLFSVPLEQRWEAGIRSLGVDPAFLASEAGHA